MIAFDSNTAERGVLPGVGAEVVPPMARACVNPASLDNGLGTLAGLMYPRTYESLIPFPSGIDTEWVRYPEIYTAECSERRFPGDRCQRTMRATCPSRLRNYSKPS